MISDERSKRNLVGVRPELVRLAEHLPGGFEFKGVPYSCSDYRWYAHARRAGRVS